MKQFQFWFSTIDISNLSSLLPINVEITTTNGSSFSFKTASTAAKYGKDLNEITRARFLKYNAPNKDTSNIPIPTDGEYFEIHVKITLKDGTVFQYTDYACGLEVFTVVDPPEYVTTGKVIEFTLSKTITQTASKRLKATLTWDPPQYGMATGSGAFYWGEDYPEREFVGYTDPFHLVEYATTPINKVCFAIQNPGIPAIEEMWTDAYVRIEREFVGNGFSQIRLNTNALKIQVRPRAEVDVELFPEFSSDMPTITIDNEDAYINGKYVLSQINEMTVNPVVRSKYIWDGDTTHKLTIRDFQHNKWVTASGGFEVTFKPGTYWDNYYYDTLGWKEHDVDYRLYLEDLWSKNKYTDEQHQYSQGYNYGSYTNFTITALLYRPPEITAFSLHRCKADASGTYRDGTTAYVKDDYGDHCIVEYTVKYTPLDCFNEMSITASYGRTTVTILNEYVGRTEAEYTQSGYIIIPADTEKTLDVTLNVTDRFTKSGLNPTLRLSTAVTLMDFKNGGDSVAFGRVATKYNTMEVNPEWALRFYKGYIYEPGSDQRTDLVALMREIESCLADLRYRSDLEYPNTGYSEIM